MINEKEIEKRILMEILNERPERKLKLKIGYKGGILLYSLLFKEFDIEYDNPLLTDEEYTLKATEHVNKLLNKNENVK